jgi:hypothetical protein
MTASRDTERLIRAFLDEGVTELPERVYDAVRSDIDRTHQRVVIGPWRTPDMNTFAKFAMAAATVLAVALVGYNLLPSDSPRGGTASASPSPSPSVTTSPSPSPSPTELAFFPSGPITPGTYSIVLSGKRFSVDMPGSGWFSDGSFRISTASGQAAFIFWTDAPTNVYADPCAKVPLDPPAGDTPAELAEAIASIPGTELVDGPSEATVGGHPAALVSIRIREDIACAPNEFMLWYSEDPAMGRWPDALGDTINSWIIDVDGTNVWIDASAGRSTAPVLHAEQRQIIESIQFE